MALRYKAVISQCRSYRNRFRGKSRSLSRDAGAQQLTHFQSANSFSLELPFAIGRFTPSTGLPVTALPLQRQSKSEDGAESLRRTVAGIQPRLSISLRQAMI
jgi:hypothetical protein